MPETDDLSRVRAHHKILRRRPGAEVRAGERHAQEVFRVPRRCEAAGRAQAAGEEEAGTGHQRSGFEDEPALGARSKEERDKRFRLERR